MYSSGSRFFWFSVAQLNLHLSSISYFISSLFLWNLWPIYIEITDLFPFFKISSELTFQLTCLFCVLNCVIDLPPPIYFDPVAYVCVMLENTSNYVKCIVL